MISVAQEQTEVKKKSNQISGAGQQVRGLTACATRRDGARSTSFSPSLAHPFWDNCPARSGPQESPQAAPGRVPLFKQADPLPIGQYLTRRDYSETHGLQESDRALKDRLRGIVREASPRLDNTKFKRPGPVRSEFEGLARNESLPKSVKACRAGRWTVFVRDKAKNKTEIYPFKCRSWRHEGGCRRWRNSQDFSRLVQAVKSRPGDFVYTVITLDQKEFKGDYIRADRVFYRRFHAWIKWIRRTFGPTEYATVMEEHRNGFPHANVILKNDWLARFVRAEAHIHPEDQEFKADVWEWGLVKYGLGYICSLEVVRDKEAIAGYFTKLMAETAKTCQLPLRAPRHFRRLRCSRGFLPPTYKQLQQKDPNKVTGIVPAPAYVIDPKKVNEFERLSAGILQERERRYIYYNATDAFRVEIEKNLIEARQAVDEAVDAAIEKVFARRE